METRSKAAKKVVPRPKNDERSRVEQEDSLDSVDSGILYDELTTPSRSKRSKKSSTNLPRPEEAKSVSEAETRLSQCDTDGDWKDTLKWLQPRRDVGLWIMCCRENCGKWRFNDAIHDPVDVPKIWYCNMQSDPGVAYCDYPQEEIPSHVFEDLIENRYNAGSIVWAHLAGYPWWPAMVDDCPNEFKYFEIGKASDIPIKYNVTFFNVGCKVEHSWIPVWKLQPYKENPKEVFLKQKRMTYLGVSYKDQVERACKVADEAQKLPLLERLVRFSFLTCYEKWVQSEIAKRSTGAHNRTCPVKLKTTVATQMEVCGESSTSLSEPPAQLTASTSRTYSQISLEDKNETERASSVASSKESRIIKKISIPQKISGDEKSSRQNASASGNYRQTGVESQKGSQKLPQVASDNPRPRSKRVSCDGASGERNSYSLHQKTSFDSQNDNERSSRLASNNEKLESFNFVTCDEKNVQSGIAKKSTGAHNRTSPVKLTTSVATQIKVDDENSTIPQKISGDEKSSRQNASASGNYRQSGVESQKGSQELPQVASDNPRPRSKRVSCDGASGVRNSYSLHQKTSFDSQNDNERSSRLASNNEKLESFNFVTCDEKNVQSGIAKKSTSAHNRTSPVKLTTSVATQMEVHDENSTIPQKISGNEKSSCENASASGNYRQTGVESQKGSQELPQVASDNPRPRSKRVSCDGASGERNSYSLHQKTSFDSQNDNERSSRLASNNEKLESFNFVTCDEENVQSGIAKKSTGAHNRTSPVKLTTSVATQMEVHDENSTIPQKISGDEKSSRQNASASGNYRQTGVESQKGSQKLPQLASDNPRPRSKRVSCDGASGERNSYSLHQKTSFDSQNDNERSSRLASNNEKLESYNFVTCDEKNVQSGIAKKSTGAQNKTSPVKLTTSVATQMEVDDENSTIPQKISGDEKSSRQNASASGNYRQTGVESQKGTQEFPQVASDNPRPGSKRVSCDGASGERNSYSLHQQPSFDSHNDYKRSSPLSSNNARLRFTKISCDDESFDHHRASTSRIYSQTVENRRGIETLTQTIASNESSRIKEFSSDDESSMQFTDSISRVHQETSGWKKSAMRRPFSALSNNASSRIKKVSFDESSIQSSYGSNFEVQQRTSVNSEEETERHSQGSPVNGTPTVRKGPWYEIFGFERPRMPVDSDKMEMVTDKGVSPVLVAILEYQRRHLKSKSGQDKS